MVGAATAATTFVAGIAPVVQAAPTTEARDTAVRADVAAPADGTYESCGAYFGFGKQEYGVLDVVDFDVHDQNGHDGIHHAVPTDTQVVLELTNADGDLLECTPEEVTQQQWDAAIGNFQINPSDNRPYPVYPGPGHYVYPSVNFGPYIDNFGKVVSVGFKVTSIPDGHTLVSPTAIKPLDVHYPLGMTDWSLDDDPNVTAFLASEVSAGSAAAFTAARTVCAGDTELTVSPELLAAVNALNTFRSYDQETADNVGCGDIGALNAEVSFQLGFEATATYTEPIMLALPEPTTTTSTTTSTTTTTTVPPTTTVSPTPAVKPAAARPVVATPTYTG